MSLELILAGAFALFGVVSAVRSLREPSVDEQGRARLLIAVHDTAKALFWFGLAGFFLAYGLAAEPQSVRWLALVPIALAVVRLLTATAIARAD